MIPTEQLENNEADLKINCTILFESSLYNLACMERQKAC